jgi:hypothetical protein
MFKALLSDAADIRSVVEEIASEVLAPASGRASNIDVV